MDYSGRKTKIEFVGPTIKENEGSLLRMFKSESFTLQMAMDYLYKYTKAKVKGVHDYLVNKLYSYKDYEIEFYAPQLW